VRSENDIEAIEQENPKLSMNPLTFDGIEIDKSSKSKEDVIDLTIIILLITRARAIPL